MTTFTPLEAGQSIDAMVITFTSGSRESSDAASCCVSAEIVIYLLTIPQGTEFYNSEGIFYLAKLDNINLLVKSTWSNTNYSLA